MGSSVTYSDTWVDSSSTSTGYVVGSGITTDSYNTYNHRYWVKPTITSPSGRTATGTSYTSSSYARLDVSLSWDYRTDLGLYTISTTHSMTCPYIFGVVSSTTGTGITLGTSTVVFENSGTRDSSNRCIMNLINNVVCTGRKQANDPLCPNYAIWIEPWYRFGEGNYFCLGFFMLTFVRDGATVVYARRWFDWIGLFASTIIFIFLCFFAVWPYRRHSSSA
jgi:hypothetical protein